jgi:hypothetical protein
MTTKKTKTRAESSDLATVDNSSKIEVLMGAVAELQKTVRELVDRLPQASSDPIGGGSGSILDRDGSVFRGGARTSSGLTTMDALSLSGVEESMLIRLSPKRKGRSMTRCTNQDQRQTGLSGSPPPSSRSGQVPQRYARWVFRCG